jgi:hypothetical protein
VRIQVHLATDAVAAEVAHDGAACPSCDLLDGCPDVAEAGAVSNDRDACFSAADSHIQQAARLGRDVPDRERRRGVAVEAAEVRGHVDVDDVADPNQLISARDAVTDDVVAARAYRGGEPVVAELTGRAADPARVRSHPFVDLRRRDAGPDARSDEGEGCCGRDTGSAHAGDLAGSEDLDVHPADGCSSESGNPIPF